MSSETPWLDAFRIIIYFTCRNLASDVPRAAARHESSKSAWSQRKPQLKQNVSPGCCHFTGWLTERVAGGDATLPPCNFSRQTSKMPRFSKVRQERKKERKKLSLWNFAGFLKVWLMVALLVSLFLHSLSSSHFASIYFSCHVVPLFPAMQSLLLALRGRACRNSQWTQIYPASTDSCRNKCTLVYVKELSWQRVTRMFTRKRNSSYNNTLLCRPFNTTLKAGCTKHSKAKGSFYVLAAVLKKYPLFWDMTLGHLAFGSRNFETTYWWHLQGSKSPGFRTLKPRPPPCIRTRGNTFPATQMPYPSRKNSS